MFGNEQTLNAGRREPADACSSQEDYPMKSESCKTARLFGAYFYSFMIYIIMTFIGIMGI